MSNPLHQISIQFRTREPFDAREAEKMRANLATALVGAAAEAGIAVLLDGGPLGAEQHVHDSESVHVCVGCIRRGQDGRA